MPKGIIKKMIGWARKQSPWVYHFPAGGGCNGCEIETLAASGPRFDPQRLGARFVTNPREADVLLINGPVTIKNRQNLIRVYNQIPDPKVVVAVGACAVSGEIFRYSYSIDCPVDKHIPVDLYVQGCPPRPHAILAAIKQAASILEARI